MTDAPTNRRFLNGRTAAVAIVSVVAVAAAAPATARAIYDAKNAHRVDGFHASELVKITYGGLGGSANYINDFDSCTFTTVYSRDVVTPRKGVLSLASTLRAQRDISDADPAQIVGQLLIDGAVVSGGSSVALDAGVTGEGTLSNLGAKKVPAGTHLVELQIRECTAGMAFIVERQVTATWSAFGSAQVAPAIASKTAARVQRDQR